MKIYDEGAGIIQGPFEDCGCLSHHSHGARGMLGCPVCNPAEKFEATCCKCGKVDLHDRPVLGVYFCGYGCT